MAQKKESNKKGVKVQDLAPKKDAKGGRFSANANRGANASRGLNAASSNAASSNAASSNASLNASNYNAD